MPEKFYYDLDLFKHFTQAGYKIKSAVCKQDKQKSRQQTVGYLNFYDEAEAERCMKEMNNTLIQNRPIFLSLQKDNVKFDAEANLIVRNLVKDVKQKEVYDMFKKFGSITSCKLESFTDGQSRGFCYIQYSKGEEAQAAIAEMNGKEVQEKKIEVMLH